MRPSTFWVIITLCATLMPAAIPAHPLMAETPQSPRLVQVPQGTIELIVSSARVLASGDIDAALRFRLQDGWHIYWRNPGDSGGPPTLRWSLPAGVTAGEIAWPTPERIPAGPLVNYGYDGDVVLPVSLRVTPAAGSRPLAIGVDVRWLVCKDICVPVRLLQDVCFDVLRHGFASADSKWLIARERCKVSVMQAHATSPDKNVSIPATCTAQTSPKDAATTPAISAPTA
jgi:DsbC/DsbD-like thiol-disulfide interchange protein